MKSLIDNVSVARFWTFLWVGGLNTLIGYLIFAIGLKIFDFQYNVSLLFAYAGGILIGYWNHRQVTFKSKASHRTAFGKFVFTYAIVYLVNVLLLTALIELLGLSPLWGQAISVVMVTLLSFVIQRSWVFRHD